MILFPRPAILLTLAAIVAAGAWYARHSAAIRADEREAVAIERHQEDQEIEKELRDAQGDNLDDAGRGDVRDRLRDHTAPFFASPDLLRSLDDGAADDPR